MYLLGYFLYSLHITGATVSLPLPHHGSQERYLIRSLIIACTYISRIREECDFPATFQSYGRIVSTHALAKSATYTGIGRAHLSCFNSRTREECDRTIDFLDYNNTNKHSSAKL